MRTFKTLLLAAVIAFSCTLSAYAKEPTEPTEPTEVETAEKTAITKEIGKLLNKPDFVIDQDVQAFVRIVFNQDNEMVVLSVECDNEMINNYIKSRLNYKKLADNVIDKDQAYIIPIRITTEE